MPLCKNFRGTTIITTYIAENIKPMKAHLKYFFIRKKKTTVGSLLIFLSNSIYMYVAF